MFQSNNLDREATLKLRELLNSNTSVWHIIYRGYRANHLSHGLIAQYKLGASSERLQHYYDNSCAQSGYQPSFAPNYSESLYESEHHSFDWKKLVGNKDNFTDLKMFFEEELQWIKNGRGGEQGEKTVSNSEEEAISHMVNLYFPQMMDGIIGHAFHGLIQLGYGLEVMNETCIAEGFAFLASVYQPMGKEPLCLSNSSVAIEPKGIIIGGDINSVSVPKDLLRSTLQRMKNDPRVRQVVQSTEFMEKRFMGSVNHVLESCTDIITDYDLVLPEHNTETTLLNLLHEIWRQLLRVYAGSGKNFFVLHCVTGTRSFQQIFDKLKSVEDMRRSIQYLWRSFIVSYFAIKTPSIDYSKSELTDQLLDETPSWDAIIQATLHEPEDRKENVHDTKVVFSCYMNEHDVGHDDLHRVIAAKQIGLMDY